MLAFVFDQALPGPLAQALVHALARCANEVPELLLGQFQFDPDSTITFGAVIPGQPEQLLGQSGGNCQESAVLDADGELSYTTRENGQESDGDRGRSCQQAVKCPFVHDCHFTFLERDDGGGTRLTVENADFSKPLPRPHYVYRSDEAFFPMRGDFRPAAQQDEELVGRIALGDYRLPGLVNSVSGQLRQTQQIVVREPFEEPYFRQISDQFIGHCFDLEAVKQIIGKPAIGL